MPKYGDLSTNKTSRETLDDIDECFRRWGVTQWDAPHPAKVGGWDATVRFVINREEKIMACSRFPAYATNLRAIYLALEAIRLATQRGLLEELPSGEATKSPWEILGIREAAYRALAQEAHPDKGGAASDMARLNDAITSIRAALKGG